VFFCLKSLGRFNVSYPKNHTIFSTTISCIILHNLSSRVPEKVQYMALMQFQWALLTALQGSWYCIDHCHGIIVFKLRTIYLQNKRKWNILIRRCEWLKDNWKFFKPIISWYHVKWWQKCQEKHVENTFKKMALGKILPHFFRTSFFMLMLLISTGNHKPLV